MKVTRIATLGLPAGLRVAQYEDKDVLELLKTPANLTIVTDVINKYLRQKDALPQNKRDLTEHIKNLGFAVLTETVKEDGKDFQVPAETASEHWERFTQSVLAGSFTHASIKISGTTPKEKEASFKVWLQSLVDTMGDIDEKGAEVKYDDKGKPLNAPFAYKLDIARPERTSTPKDPAKQWVEAATNIINNGSEAKWAERFTKGFKDANGVQIDPIAFEPFDVKPAKGADAAAVQAVREQNIRNLALAITAKEKQVRDKTEAKKLAEFA